MSSKSVYFSIVLFLCLGVLLINVEHPIPLLSWILFVLSFLISLLAVVSRYKHRSRYQTKTITTPIVTQGVYTKIRHPLYLTVILIALGAFITNPNWWRFILMVILIDDLRSKIVYEEKLLIKNFPEYKDYQRLSKKLIPFVY